MGMEEPAQISIEPTIYYERRSYILSPFGWIKILSWCFLTMGWSFLVEEVHIVLSQDTKLEFTWITMLFAWIFYSFLLVLAFAPRSVTALCYQINLNNFDFWVNFLSSVWCLVCFCLCISAVSDNPLYTYDVRNATAWCFFAFVSTGVDAALVLGQVAIIPIPEWWPFQGMQIPEDDNMGAPMPKPEVNTATATAAVKAPEPKADTVVDIFAAPAPTPAAKS